MLHATVSQTGTGTPTVVAAQADHKIVLLEATFEANAAGVDITLKSGTTAISPVFSLASGLPLILPESPDGWMETSAGQALILDCAPLAEDTVVALVGYEYRRV